jgi:hypothetical protein
LIENFAAGLDTRKSPLTAPAGTLLRLKNAVITPGGEIAKRRAFVKVADLHPSSFGLAATEDTIATFGRNTTLPVYPINPPISGVTLVSKDIPNSAPNLVQTDFDVFDGNLYIACYNPAGTSGYPHYNPHYYDDPNNAASVSEVIEGNGKGYYVRTVQTKMYAIAGKYLYFSAVKQPMAWNKGSPILDPSGKPTTGMGFVNLALTDADSERLSGLEIYYNKLAVFSTEAIQVWSVDPDPLQNHYDQLLRGSGTYASYSPLQYGNGDVLFLDHSGVRSMKARDSSNSASVSDIGSPIDSIISTLEITLGQSFMGKAVSLLEPYVGRFWLVLPDRVYVLSYFPGPKITAWSHFTLPFTMQYAVVCGGRIFMRDTANQLWVYGGSNGQVYDNCGVEVRLPYLDGKKPGHRKQFLGFDATVSYDNPTGTLQLTGAWTVAVSYDFNNPDAEETIATIDRPTWNAGRAEQVGEDSHFSLRFYNNDALPATISNCAVHYEMADDEA